MQRVHFVVTIAVIFSTITTMAAACDSKYLVGDMAGNRVLSCDPSAGNECTDLGLDVRLPYAAIVDKAKENYIVSTHETGQGMKRCPIGGGACELIPFSITIHQPAALRLYDDGNTLLIAVHGSHKVLKCSAACKISGSNSCICETVAGTGKALNGINDLKYPYDAVLDATGENVFIADTGNYRIQKCPVGEGDCTTFTTMVSNPFSLLLSEDGQHLFVADTGHHRIVKCRLALANSCTTFISNVMEPRSINWDKTHKNLLIVENGKRQLQSCPAAGGPCIILPVVVNPILGGSTMFIADTCATTGTIITTPPITTPTTTVITVKDTCEASDCAANSVKPKSPFPAQCADAACTQTECCDPYKPCGVTDWKAINLNVASTVANVHMTSSKTELEVTGLTYDYEECVDPSFVSFEAFVKDASGNCGTVSLGKSSDPSAVVQFVGTPARETAGMILTIDGGNINAGKLGSAYAKTSGANPTVTVEICVRASVKSGAVEVLFTEDILTISYQAKLDFKDGDAVSVNVVRTAAGQVTTTVEAQGTVASYQCDKDFAELSAPISAISQEAPLLRVCIEGASDAVKCKNIIAAILKQTGNSIEDQLVTDGSAAAFSEISTQGKKCMLTTLLTSKYFVKATSTTSLNVAITGSIAMEFAPARRLRAGAGRRLQEDETTAPFEASASVEAGEVDAATGAHGIAAGVFAAITLLL